MKPLFLFLFMVYSACLLAQLDTTIYGMEINANNIKARINSNGSLFYDYETGQGEFFPNYIQGGTNYTTLNNVGLWMGGLDKGGNLKTAAHNIEGGTTSDFAGGIINKDKTAPLQYSNKIWKVTRQQIEAHRADWKDNGKIDNPIAEIYAWPGYENAYSLSKNGFKLPINQAIEYAPFYDVNFDGFYSPNLGDYPEPNIDCIQRLPDTFYWYAFHDFKPHTLTKSEKGMDIEIHVLVYAYSCDVEQSMNNSIFVDYDIYNLGTEYLDSLLVGLCADFSIGCTKDDYVGTIPEYNTFYAYNETNQDECYGEYPPVQAVTLYDSDAYKIEDSPISYIKKFDVMQPIAFDNTVNGLPKNAAEYYRMLNGESRVEADPTLPPRPKIWYPEHPYKGQNSELQKKRPPGHRRMLGVSVPFKLNAEKFARYRYVFTTYGVKASDSVLKKIDAVYNSAWLFEGIWKCDVNNFSCKNFTLTDENLDQNLVSIFPNPAKNAFSIQNNSSQHIDIQLINTLGVLLEKERVEGNETSTYPIEALPSGIYFLNLLQENKVVGVKKIVVE
jgi:hypothetical protein